MNDFNFSLGDKEERDRTDLVCLNGKPAWRTLDYDCSGTFLGEIFTGVNGEVITLGATDEWFPGACPDVDPLCAKWQSLVLFIDNTGTRFNESFEFLVTLSDGTTATVIDPGGHAGWTAQLNAWVGLFAAAFPDCKVEARCNLPAGCGGLLPPPSDAQPSKAIQWRYMSMVCCPTQASIIQVEIVDSSNPKRIGKNLVLESILTAEKRGWICAQCCPEGQEPVLLDEQMVVIPEADLPVCWFECSETIPEPPLLACTFTTVPGCDDLGDDDSGTWVNMVRVYQDCGDGISFSDYIEDDTDPDGGLVDYDLVGDFRPGCFESDDCTFVEIRTLCDESTGEKVDFVIYECEGELIETGPFVTGTDLPYDGKGPYIECVCDEREILDVECFEVPLFAYNWDNGIRHDIDSSPLQLLDASLDPFPGYLPPEAHGTVTVNGVQTYPGNGFIDKKLQCGTATIDNIIIDGANVLPTPVVEVTTSGTWGPLNNLLWATLEDLGYSTPRGIACDDFRDVGGRINCYGQSISCQDINLESFQVTDCVGNVWIFGFEKIDLGATQVDRVRYFDCEGTLVCEWIDRLTKEVIPEPDPLCVTPCPDPLAPHCDAVATEFQNVRWTQTVAEGTDGFYSSQNPGFFAVIDFTETAFPVGCGDPNVSTTEFPILIELVGEVNGTAFTATTTINSQADWTFDGNGVMTNVLDIIPSSLFDPYGITFQAPMVAIFPDDAPDFWITAGYLPAAADCAWYSYGVAWQGGAGYEWFRNSANPASFDPVAWQGPYSIPNNGSGAGLDPNPAFDIEGKATVEVVKCINYVDGLPVIDLSYFNLDGTAFTLPTGSSNIIWAGGACPVPVVETREVCVDLYTCAYLVIGRDPVTGEVEWTRVEDAEGNAISGTVTECECAPEATPDTRCEMYNGAGFQGSKDVSVAPCGPYEYTVELNYGGTIYGPCNFTVNTSWDIADVGFGLGLQAVPTGVNNCLAGFGISDIAFYGGNGQNGARIVEYDSTSPQWTLHITEDPPACDPDTEDLDIVWIYVKGDTAIADTFTQASNNPDINTLYSDTDIAGGNQGFAPPDSCEAI